MNLLRYYSVLNARRKMLAATVASVVAVVMTISLVLPKTYTAGTELLVDVRTADPVAGVALGSALPPEVLFGYLTTQAEVIVSERTTTKVISKLQLDKNDGLRAVWSNGPSEKMSFESWLIESLKKKITVSPSRDSNVITIAFSNSDPAMAAQIANAYAQAYLETDLDLKVEPARKSAAWFDERSKEVREKLDKAQTRLSDYQRQKGIVIADEKLDVENARLDELSKQLIALQAASAESESKQRQAGALPEVVQSPAVLALRGELAKQEAKLREMSRQLGPNHPQYQRLQAEVGALRERVTIETAQVAGSIGATARVNQQREAQLRAAYEAQKNKVLTMKTVRDEATLLLRDVENAKREYDLLIERLAKSNLESRANQSNVTVLNRATAPIFPSSPKLKLNLILSIFGGTLLGVLIAFVLEAADRRFRDTNDLAENLHLPVLGVLELGTPGPRLAPGKQMPRLLGVGSGQN